MSDDMTIVQFLRASGEHWDEDRYTAGADRIEALEAALESIWLQLEPGKSEISNVPVMRVNIGALVMNALPNKLEKASTI